MAVKNLLLHISLKVPCVSEIFAKVVENNFSSRNFTCTNKKKKIESHIGKLYLILSFKYMNKVPNVIKK